LGVARELYGVDPLLYNELGVVSYLEGAFDLARKYLLIAADLMCGGEGGNLIIFELL
jgi:Flp pilus assembly protein TadD